MAKRVHYEVFVIRAGTKTWVLHEPFDDRAAAMNSAKYALMQKGFTGAKVVKETQDLVTGQYMPINIFEEGGVVIEKKAKDEVRLPCVRPQDLYTLHAREIIGRVLNDALNRWGLTPMEMLHRADIVEELQATDTLLQHAMQKWAVTLSSSENLPIAEVMRQLDDLVSRSIDRLFKDERAGVFVDIEGRNLAGVWPGAKTNAEPGYVLAGCIARTLGDFVTWSQKLPHLLGLMQNLPEDDAGSEMCLGAVDDFVAELVSERAALSDLIGEREDLGASLILMIDLFLGKADNADFGDNKGVIMLARRFGEGKLPHSRGAVVKRIMDELTGPKSLSPDDIHREVEITRLLAKRMVLCQGPMVSIDNIVAAFEQRSTRLTTPEMAENYMAEAKTPDERIEFLLDLEDNIIGAANKARLVNYIFPILTGPKMEPHFLKDDEPLIKRLGCLVVLQKRILKSGFPEGDRVRLSEAVDSLAVKVEQEGKLFLSVSMRKASVASKAVTLLRLLDADILAQGACSKAAAKLIVGWMRDPGFHDALKEVSFQPREEEVSQVEEFRAMMERTGVREMLKQPEPEPEVSEEDEEQQQTG